MEIIIILICILFLYILISILFMKYLGYIGLHDEPRRKGLIPFLKALLWIRIMFK